MKKRMVQVVLSTHWDREWRESFQDIRYALVRLLDRTFAAMKDGRLHGPFHTDGQSILLDDYLEVRPERRAEVEKMAKAGQLEIGPWYSMPDEFTVSGEALIRNLLMGRQSARAYGAKPSNAGYVPDMFGHNSQLPQIFAGCGVTGAYIWRGVNNVEQRNFIWRGADGTEMPTHKFGKMGYGTYGHQVGRRHDFLKDPEDDPQGFAASLLKYLHEEARTTAIDPILVLEGGDHQEWNPRQYPLIFSTLENHPEFKVVHTSLGQNLRDLLAQRGKITAVLEGELHEPGKAFPPPGVDGIDSDAHWVIPGVLSSRVRLKQANGRCQTLLCQWAEPFRAYARSALGLEYPQGYLNVAWKWLLQNHAHDSIDTCSIDQVHKDMEYRFDQTQIISERLVTEATSRIAASVEGSVPDDELRVTVFNPLVRDFNHVGEINLELPVGWPVFNEFFGFEPKPSFRIYAADGAEIPYQRLAQAMNRSRQRVRQTKWPEFVSSNHIKVALPLAVPASGYTTLTVRAPKASVPTRHPEAPGLATSERSLANEHFGVQIESNGTLTLTDKHTGRVYSRLLTFEERADIGDGWYHGIAANDQIFASTACRAEVALVHNGPMLTTFRVRTLMRVPEDFRFDTMTRSDRWADLAVDNFISLRPGQDYLDIETRVDNTADDHRLRVLFPSGAKTDTFLTDTAFDVVERPIAIDRNNHTYRELEVETKPQQSWTAVHDAKGGLAVVGDALLESAVPDHADRSIALTLFRGTRRTVFTNGEPNGQMRGMMTFRYRLVPLAGKPDRTRLCELGQQLSAGLRIVQLRKEDVAIYREGRTLPPTAGFLRLEGPAVVSSVRQVGGGVEVRMFNPRLEAITATLETKGLAASAKRPFKVERVDMESKPIEPLSLGAHGKVKVALAPKQIVTLRLT